MGLSHTPRDIELQLKKREQELECLYRLGLEIRSDKELKDILLQTTAHLIDGLQFPRIASARIILDGASYSSKPISADEVAESFSCNIVIKRKRRGVLEVCYREKAGFLESETKLVKEIGTRLSRTIERHELTAELQRSKDQLEELVKEKTRELERSKKRYEDLFEDAPIPMLMSRLNGDIVKANRAFYRLFGYPEDGSVHLNFVKDKLYEDPAVRKTLFDKLRESGYVEGFELSLLDREGNPIPVIGSYVLIDVDGEQCLESVYKDIRIRKALERRLIEQNENLEKGVRERTIDLENQKDLLVKKNQELTVLTEKLRTSKTRIQALFNAITDSVCVIDSDFNMLLSNKKNIGNKGKCYKKIFNLDERCEDCPAVKVIDQKTSVTQEKMIGEEHYLLHTYPIFDSKNNIEAVLEIARVITKEKNMEKQLLQADKLASLGQLVSGIGHEINNPNTFIRGNLYIMQEAMTDIFPILDQHAQSRPDLKIARLNYNIFKNSVPVLLDDMAQGANRIKGIVDGLKKFAKRDEGLLNEVVNVNQITESCLRLVDNQIRRTADVRMELDPNLPTIMGNSQKLQQVIVNILINASQSIENKKGTIRVASNFDENEVVLRVKDDGKGMDEKTVSQMFDPFFTTKRRQGGTGLGLSIAYGIIKEHKGRIDVDSKLGVGTTFCIHLLRNAEEKR